MSSFFELKGPQGHRIVVDREQVRVGRASDNSVVLRDARVSRYHVNFYLSEGNLIVEDAGSQNGFLVNGAPGSGAMILKSGDKVFFGASEYVVQKVGELQLDRPDSARINVNQLNTLSETPKNNPRKLYMGLAVIFCIAAIYKSEVMDKEAPVKPNESELIEVPLTLDAPESRHVAKSPTEITAEGKFREGMRDFYNGNYTQAKMSFDEAYTLNPSQLEAQEYLIKTNNAIELKVKNLLKDAITSYSNLHYQRARGQAFEVLSIISEEVPGWSRKLAAEQSGEFKEDRKEGQEDILLNFQCERTERKKECGDAVNIIKSSRQKLGVEDALK